MVGAPELEGEILSRKESVIKFRTDVTKKQSRLKSFE